jgi:hypothetical protein
VSTPLQTIICLVAPFAARRESRLRETRADTSQKEFEARNSCGDSREPGIPVSRLKMPVVRFISGCGPSLRKKLAGARLRPGSAAAELNASI